MSRPLQKTFASATTFTPELIIKAALPHDRLIVLPAPVGVVDHIAPELRVTLVDYKRDKALEDKIKFKVDEARKFFDQVVKQISDEHSK